MKSIYRTVNVVLLILMMIVIAMFLYWQLLPGSLDARGQGSIREYIAEGDAQAASALELLAAGDPSEAMETLIEWEEIGIDDRYYPDKRTILLALSQHLFEAGEYEEVVELVSPSLDENDRDITLFFEWSKSALNIAELNQEAETGLALMAKRFPDHAELQEIYIKDVLFKDDEVAASQALANAAAPTPEIEGWSVSWQLEPDAQQFEEPVPAEITLAARLWGFTVPAPTTAATLRIDPPANASFDISNIQITAEGESTTYGLLDVIEVGTMEASNGVLSVSGSPDSYFVIPAPDWLSLDESIATKDIRIAFNITNIGQAAELSES